MPCLSRKSPHYSRQSAKQPSGPAAQLQQVYQIYAPGLGGATLGEKRSWAAGDFPVADHPAFRVQRSLSGPAGWLMSVTSHKSCAIDDRVLALQRRQFLFLFL
tara:strand:+ start:346 stop:654 length:309 start_codon:yes stop_codon:yes gene_type:complete